MIILKVGEVSIECIENLKLLTNERPKRLQDQKVRLLFESRAHTVFKFSCPLNFLLVNSQNVSGQSQKIKKKKKKKETKTNK